MGGGKTLFVGTWVVVIPGLCACQPALAIPVYLLLRSLCYTRDEGIDDLFVSNSLLAVSNLPARRKELIDKVKMAADMLSVELEEAMCKDRLQAVEDLQQLVEFYARPYQDAAQHRLDHYLDIQEELLQTEKKLRVLQAEIRNIVTF